MKKITYRIEEDSLGKIKVPKSALYGAQTQRAFENFPVSDLKTPTVEDCLQGWNAHLPDIKNVQKTTKKPILFTEFGYRSFDFSGKKPWLTGNYDANPNLEAQVNTTNALFETFWEEDWFAGGFVWKWFHNYEQSGGAKDNMFTPQNKPAEEIIRQYYKK